MSVTQGLTYHWPCNTPPKAALLLIHGMTEHLAYYSEFAQWLSDRGIAVGGTHLPGHGPEAQREGTLGDPGPQGWQGMRETSYNALLALQTLYPSTPLFVLGHSMGSYVAQSVLDHYKPAVQGLLLSATSYESPLLTGLAWLLAKSLSSFAPLAKGRLFYKIIYGGFNQHIKNPKTPFDWLSRDQTFVHRYMADPLCTVVPSVRFYSALFGGLFHHYRRTPCGPTVPIYLFSGYEDPLGKKLRSVFKVAHRYAKAGHQVDMALYPDGRHVMLAELQASQVYDGIFAWLTKTHTKTAQT